MMNWFQPIENEEGFTSTEEQRTACNEIQPLPVRNATLVPNAFSTTEEQRTACDEIQPLPVRNATLVPNAFSTTEEQHTACDEIQPLPVRDATPVPNDFSSSEGPPIFLPSRIQRNLPAMDFRERTIPPFPFEEGSESYTKKNKDAIRNFIVRINVPDLRHHCKQKSPVSSIGYAAVNSKYLFRPI
uniref:Uncharacterized protein n=1 Tax=Chaetoceros debilis TaxID=122233 RepID=A0A6S8T8Q3_9STRA